MNWHGAQPGVLATALCNLFIRKALAHLPKLCFWQQLVRRDGGRRSQQLLTDYYLRLQIVE
jgi:hypothetical protein